MAMVEIEQQHRMAQDRRALNAEMVDVLGGKLLGGLMTIASIGASVYSVHIGAHWLVSAAIVGVPITALIGKFIRSK